jgi:hypothetical protein
MGLKHGYQATGTNDGAKQVSVDRWNADHVIDSEIDIPVLASDPAPPADGFCNFYAKKIGGRTMLMQMGPTGLDTSFQPNLGGNKVATWMPPGNGTTVPGVIGMAALTATGTATARNVATTNMLTRMTRLAYVSAATAGSLAGAREAAAKYTTGAGGGLGGFFYRCRFGVSDAAAVAGARMFVGLDAATGAPTNVEPNSKVNAIGVVQQSTSNNLQIYCAGSAAGANLVDLGANFPANTLSTDVYELALFSPSANGNVYYKVTRLNTGHTAEGVFTTGLPTSATLLCHQLWRCNNATALAVGLDICGIYMETDY